MPSRPFSQHKDAQQDRADWYQECHQQRVGRAGGGEGAKVDYAGDGGAQICDKIASFLPVIPL